MTRRANVDHLSVVRCVAGILITASVGFGLVASLAERTAIPDVLPVTGGALVTVGVLFICATAAWFLLAVRLLRTAANHGYHRSSLLSGLVFVVISVINLAIVLTVV